MADPKEIKELHKKLGSLKDAYKNAKIHLAIEKTKYDNLKSNDIFILIVCSKSENLNKSQGKFS